MPCDVERSASGWNRGGPSIGLSRAAKNMEVIRLGPRVQPTLTFSLSPDGEPVTVRGRLAQTLDLLVRVGAAGFTSEETSRFRWARRMSNYVLRLRRLGVPISTTRELVGDAPLGRYSLSGPVVLVRR